MNPRTPANGISTTTTVSIPHSHAFRKGDRKLISAWTLYDWANSSYPMVITSTIFPIFYETLTSQRGNGRIINDMVTVFGMSFKNTELYTYVVALSFVIVAISSPILSGIADSSGSKRFFLKFFCYLGSICCASLSLFSRDYLAFGMVAVMFASVGYWGSTVFYNAYLPEIAEPEDHDRVSALGFARGYLGGVVLLIANLILMKGFGMPARFAFISVALWWVGFAQLTFPKLPKGESKDRSRSNIITKGFRELWTVWKEFRQILPLKRFLSSFFVYSMGVQTVMLMAVLFAKKEIFDVVQVTEIVNGSPVITTKEVPLSDTALIVSILLIQFLGIVGSNLFSRVSARIGNLRALQIILFIWVAICVSIYFWVQSSVSFYLIAAMVGLVMGGVQALSRSTYSKLIPQSGDNASYFSFYDVCEKVGIVIGMFSFGFIEGVTGGMRNSVLALVTFFVVGFILLLTVPRTKTVQ